MDFSTFYNMYSDAMASGKLDVLIAFLNALKGHPFLTIFFTWLLFRDPKKTFREFKKRFI